MKRNNATARYVSVEAGGLEKELYKTITQFRILKDNVQVWLKVLVIVSRDLNTERQTSRFTVIRLFLLFSYVVYRLSELLPVTSQKQERNLQIAF